MLMDFVSARAVCELGCNDVTIVGAEINVDADV
jgi:hypothetical protein